MTAATTQGRRETYLFRRLDNGKVIRRRMTFQESLDLGVLRRIALRGGAEAVLIGNENGLQLTTKEKRAVRRGVARWPMTSVALSVDPGSAAAYNEDARRAGLTGVHFDRDGTCRISDPGQRKRYARHRQVIDKDTYGGRL